MLHEKPQASILLKVDLSVGPESYYYYYLLDVLCFYDLLVRLAFDSRRPTVEHWALVTFQWANG